MRMMEQVKRREGNDFWARSDVAPKLQRASKVKIWSLGVLVNIFDRTSGKLEMSPSPWAFPGPLRLSGVPTVAGNHTAL